ncbi:hypothetical protein TELCIR_22434, partial [Teladorsagia circumcincta]
LFSNSTFEYAINPEKKEPTLMAMTKKALEIMEKSDRGFFLLVEGGLIDIAEHKNRMYDTFVEMHEFEEAIRENYSWLVAPEIYVMYIKARQMTDSSETLIVVTADHAHAFTIPGYVPLQESIFGKFLV